MPPTRCDLVLFSAKGAPLDGRGEYFFFPYFLWLGVKNRILGVVGLSAL